MRWSKLTLRQSLSSLLGRTAGRSSVGEDELEDIREMMLDLLADARSSKALQTTRRVRYATSIEDFWYLRGELMQALAELNGEAAAREQVAEITARFRGLLPKAFNSRFSTLRE